MTPPNNTPSAEVGGEDKRTQVARIVDPAAWERLDRALASPYSLADLNAGRAAVGMPPLGEVCAPSLAKADEILAALQVQP